jgi:glycosyltransferase involved in cell wall biosynthesis
MGTIQIIAAPFPIGGGGSKRSLEVLKRLGKYCSFSVILSPPEIKDIIYSHIKNGRSITEIYCDIEHLRDAGIVINPGSIQYIDDLVKKLKELKNPQRVLKYRGIISKFLFKYEIESYINTYLQFDDDTDLVYSHHESLDSVWLSYNISKRLKKPLIILLQSEPYREGLGNHPIKNLIEFFLFLLSRCYKILRKSTYSNLMLYPSFKGFISVSMAPLSISNLLHANYFILKPPVAFNKDLLEFRKNLDKKDDYAVFFARMAREKGVLELPRIWKDVIESGYDRRLLVYGKPQPELTEFKAMITAFGLEERVLYQGYIAMDEISETISKAILCVYPSHADSFSLTILESLAVGTPVVAYGIQAIEDIYSGIPGVRLVKEWDTEAMARNIIEMLNLSQRDYRKLMENDKISEFLHHHSSWDTVAEKEADAIKLLLTAHNNGYTDTK